MDVGSRVNSFMLALAFVSLLATPASLGAPPAVLDLNTLEQRFLGRAYEKDATDKRIQRLELLLYGATQDGGLVERLDRLQETATEHAKASKSAANPASDTAAIGALERKILKKSFDSESPSQRLARLESKVFGQASPNMNLSDRVSRLKKILNIDTPAISQYPSFQEPPPGAPTVPFGGGFVYSSPFGPGNQGSDDIQQHMNEAIRQLNRSLRGMHRLPDGTPNVSPFMGPNGTPFIQPFRTIPQRGRDTELPPYLDPNSI